VVASFAFPFAATVAATVVPAASIATGRNPATPKWGLVEKCLSQAYSTYIYIETPKKIEK
jgi:hypothetical protein